MSESDKDPAWTFAAFLVVVSFLLGGVAHACSNYVADNSRKRDLCLDEMGKAGIKPKRAVEVCP